MTQGFDFDEIERLLAAATPDPAPRSLRELDERGYARRAFGNAMIEAAPAMIAAIRELRATVATLGDGARAGANVLDAKDTEIRELRAENARLAAENAYLRGKCEGHEIARAALGESQ